MRTCASTGLLSSGTVVLFLSDESDVVDPGVYRILGQGSWVAQVHADGRLVLPFLEPDEARRLMGGVVTLEDLRRAAAAPGRVVHLETRNGVPMRVEEA